jgi:EamA domain-containing membrane protein RarD
MKAADLGDLDDPTSHRQRLTHAYAVAFSCIWTALAMFAPDMIARQRRS